VLPLLNRYLLAGIALASIGVLGFSLRPVLTKIAYTIGPDPIVLLALRMAFALPFFVHDRGMGRTARARPTGLGRRLGGDGGVGIPRICGKDMSRGDGRPRHLTAARTLGR